MTQPDPCPDCGLERTAGICPLCLIGLGLNGPGKGLSQPTLGGSLETLIQSIGPMPRVLLRDTENFTGPGPIVRPGSPEMPDLAERAGRLQLFGEIARGGMGAVLKGRDNDLGRDLAVKVLLERHGNDPALLKRFVEEAQIAGQLQHPGVVPVYELGAFADQRPYFAMKLVKGRTLAEVLDDRTDPSADRPRLLSIFLDVAQTMAYAHARGVIHRDLKPSNVMVGSFGEVQVMDWGLAKVLARGGVVDDRSAGRVDLHETVIATVRSGSDSGSDLSHAGSVLGTPSYMAPEQARGENENLDERADVFALGSILCEILTGKPAFVGRSSGEILRLAARGELAGAWNRLEACGADTELVNLVRAALAPEADDRLPHAGAIVDRLSSYLAGVQARVQAAERDRAVAQAQAIEERRRRKLQLGLAASILALALVGGLGGAAYWQQRQDRIVAAGRLLGEAETLLARANQQPDEVPRWREARAAAARVDAGQLGEPVALARLEKIKAEAEAGLLDAERDAELRQALVEVRIARLDVGWDQTNEAYGRAFRDGGLDFDTLSVAELVARLKKRPPAVLVEVVAFLDHWQLVSRTAGKPQAEREKIQAVAIAADDDPFRNQLRSIIYAKDRTGRDAKLKALADDPRSGELSGPTALLLAMSFSKNDDQIAQFRKAVVGHPDDVWLNFNLASRLNQMKPPPREEVIRYHSAARACRPEVGLYLAQVLATMERFDEAEAIFRDLLTRRPDTMSNYFAFATFLENRGRTEEAKQMESQAILAGRRAIARRPQDVSARFQLARTLSDRGKYDEAIAEYRETIRLNPGNDAAHNNLGVNLAKQGKIDEAIAAYREAIRLNPGNNTAHRNLALNLSNQGKLDEAIAGYRELIRLKPDEPIRHYDLAGFLKARGKTDEAIAEYRETIRLDGKHIGNAPFDLGDMLHQMGRYDEARAVFRQILELAPADPSPNEPVPRKLATTHTRIGWTLAAQGKTDEATAEFRETIRLNPGNDSAHNNLGVNLAKLGKIDEAIAEYRQAIRLNPGNDTAHGNLAINLSNQGKLDEAIAAYREAIRLKPGNATTHLSLGANLFKQGKIDEAIAAYRELIRLKPDEAIAHYRLGGLLKDQGKPDEAIAHYREAIRLDGKHVGSAPFDLGDMLHQMGRHDEALAVFRQILELAPADPAPNEPVPQKLAKIHSRIGLSLSSQSKFDEAIAESREAIRLNPDHAQAHSSLGYALRGSERFDEAIASYRRYRELSGTDPDKLADIDKAIADIERCKSVVGRIDAVVKGEVRPGGGDELRVFRSILYFRAQHAAVVRLTNEAFRADPGLADDLESNSRYRAAYSAVLASSGKARDDSNPDAEARARYRRQALDWLKADLALQSAAIQSGKPEAVKKARKSLQFWKTDSDLASVRGAEAIAGLPEAERREWQAFWAEVDGLLANAPRP